MRDWSRGGCPLGLRESRVAQAAERGSIAVVGSASGTDQDSQAPRTPVTTRGQSLVPLDRTRWAACGNPAPRIGRASWTSRFALDCEDRSAAPLPALQPHAPD